MPEQELQNQIDMLRNDFESHDHLFEGKKLNLRNHLSFGYHQVSKTLESGDASITTRYGRFFNTDFDIEIISAEETHQAAAGSADTLDIYKLTSGQATSAGVSVLASVFTVNSTANTPVRRDATTVRNNRILKRGDGLAFITSGTFASLDTLTITVYYLPLGIKPKF